MNSSNLNNRRHTVMNFYAHFLLLFHQTSIAILATLQEFKVLKKVIITETFNIEFHNIFIKIKLFCFFYFSSYCQI